MALIDCPECGKKVSDKAVSCPNCGYPIKLPEPHYRDITHSIDIDWCDVYYDEKNKRIISRGEYFSAKERYDQERKQYTEECYRRTKHLIEFLRDACELDEVKAYRCFNILANEDLAEKYSDEGIAAMRKFLRNYLESKKAENNLGKGF